MIFKSHLHNNFHTPPPEEMSLNDFLLQTIHYMSRKYGKGVIGIDFNGNIEFVSADFLKIINYEEDDILGKNIEEFIGEENFKIFIDRFLDLLNGDLPLLAFECPWGQSTDNPLFLSFTFYPPRRKNKLLSGFVQKKAFSNSPLQLIIPTQAYLEQIMNNIQAVMWLTSSDLSQVYYMSPNFERLFELSFDEIEHNPDAFTDRIHPEDRDMYVNAYSAAKACSINEFGYRYLLKNGSWRHITTYRFPIKDESGNMAKLAGICIDDTNLYLARKKVDIQQEILTKKNKELQKTNKMLEDFNAFACHDLSQPLRVFHTHTQILEKNYLGKLDEEGERILNSIYSAIHRMQDLVKGMADFSIIKDEDETYPPADVKRLLEQNILPLFINKLYPQCQIQTGELHPLRASENHLMILFKNLIENSIKYNNNPPLIKINSQQSQEGVIYTITDNGIGIPKEAHKQIFTLGRRLHCKPDQNGAGIGLSACEKIMSFYGGKIWVESAPDKGATFYLLFP